MVTSQASSGFWHKLMKVPAFCRVARYSGRYRPAWRIIHTGVTSTGSRIKARKNRSFFNSLIIYSGHWLNKFDGTVCAVLFLPSSPQTRTAAPKAVDYSTSGGSPVGKGARDFPRGGRFAGLLFVALQTLREKCLSVLGRNGQVPGFFLKCSSIQAGAEHDAAIGNRANFLDVFLPRE